VTQFVEQYGLLVVFFVVALESAGVPLPGETALVAAAILASQGHFSLAEVIVVGAVAAIIGDNAGYWAGRLLGRGFLQRYDPIRRFSDRVLPPAERFFKRHGGKAIFLARWTSGLRVAGAWIAGFAHMEWWRFFFWNATGGIFWSATVCVVAYYFGRAAADAIAKYGLIAGAVAVGLAVLVWLALHVWRRRMAEET
jgi:membrane protein DedA with SNARE-associated domain